MKIKFRRRQRKRIRKFLSGFHGKELTDLYREFTSIAHLLCSGCQWKIFPRYYQPPGTAYYHSRKWSESTSLVAFLRRLLTVTLSHICSVDRTEVTFASATRWRFSSSLSVTMDPHRSLKI